MRVRGLGMMSSAQREYEVAEGAGETAEFQLVAPGRVTSGLVTSGTELKQEVTARLAAHRRRRAQVEESGVEAGVPAGERPGRRQNAIATAVAERYARTPSYRAFLAAQSARAVEEAEARAEVARRNAEAVAAVQQELLGELELWDAPQEFSAATAEVLAAGEPMPQNLDSSAISGQALGHPDARVEGVEAGGLTVRLYEDLGARMSSGVGRGECQAGPDEEERRALDAEIAFRKAPVFEAQDTAWEQDGLRGSEETEPLPANLLEFPRQLVATWKARPRLAEGPLREEAPRSSQLRIFEVEPEQISTAPVAAAVPEWSLSIRLDAHTPGAAVESEAAPIVASPPAPQIAPMALRTMAGLVDGGLVLGGLVAFVAVFAKVAGQVQVGYPAGIALAGVAIVFWLLYQALFFWLSEQTPGMRYAKIGLCTFADENPTRAAMRRRILAQAAALCPLGLGLLWCFLDEDGLGWHDRLSRMYQRAY